jgi:hypothetical protein
MAYTQSPLHQFFDTLFKVEGILAKVHKIEGDPWRIDVDVARADVKKLCKFIRTDLKGSEVIVKNHYCLGKKWSSVTFDFTIGYIDCTPSGCATDGELFRLEEEAK